MIDEELDQQQVETGAPYRMDLRQREAVRDILDGLVRVGKGSKDWFYWRESALMRLERVLAGTD